MCMNEQYGTGRLLVKAQLAQRVCKGSWKSSANYSCESQGSKNRLTNPQLWHNSPEVTFSYMKSFS